MKYFLIYNPTARQGRSMKEFRRIISILRNRGVSFECAQTTRKNEAIDLAKLATKDKFDVVVPIGGDGTICEVITGLLSQQKETMPIMGVIHIGTSPDFNRYHQIPIKVDEAIEVLLNGKTRKIDIGKVMHTTLDRKEGTVSYFGGSVNIGLGPSIASRSNRRYRKYLGDFLGTLSSTLVSLANFNPINLKLKVDGRSLDFENIINLTVGKDPYLASGMRVPMEMAQDNGNLYLLSIRGRYKLPVIANLWRLYLGNILDYSGAKLLQCREVEVMGKENEKLEFDGDVRGYLPAKIEVVPRSLEVLVK